MFSAVYVALFLASDQPVACQASAAHNVLDFCLVTEITVTNNSAVDLTDQPVRVLIPASSMIGGDQLDARGWDLFPIMGDASNEIEVLSQSLTSSQAPFWFNVPDLPAGESRKISLYTGSGELRRDNGIRFTGNEQIVVTDHADFDITDNIDVVISLTNHDETARDEVILDKLDAGTGYQVEFVDVASALTLRTTINAATCDLTWSSAWTDVPQLFRFEYIAAAGIDTTIYRDGSSAVTCDIDQGAIGTNAQDIYIGTDELDTVPLTGATVLTVEIRESAVRAGQWGFDGRRTAETNSTNPYLGTTQDYTGNGHTANYTFDNDQSSLAFAVSVVSPNQFVPGLTLTEENSVVGAPVIPGFENARPTVASGVLFSQVVSPLQNVATATGVPAEGAILAFFYVVSLVLAFIVWRLTNGFLPAAVLTMGVGPTIAVILGYVPEWSLIIWGLLVAVVWFAQLRSQEAG